MCDPASATVAIVAMAASATAAYQQQKQQNAIMEAQAKNMEAQAEMQNRQAIELEEEGERRAKAHRKSLERIKGEQRFNMSGSGAVVDAGSFGAILDQTDYEGELDALAILNDSKKQAYAARTGAAFSMNDAGINRMGRNSPWARSGLQLIEDGGSWYRAYKSGGKKSPTGGTDG